MTKPINKDQFDLADVEATLEIDEAAESKARTQKRKKLFAGFAAGLLLAGGGYYGYEALHAGHVTTDNAYVGADIAQVTPLVAGHVARVLVSDAQTVTAGQPLVVLDQTDARLALAEAEAAYDQARRRVTGYVATDRQLAAQISMRGADANRAAADVQSAAAGYERARLDYSRRAALAETGAISGEELSTSRAAFEQAQAALSAARAAQAQASSSQAAASGQRDSNQALISGASVEGNPEVEAARARLAQARVNLERTIIRAPVPGIVSRRQVQVGQRVQPGAILMVVVPVQSAYVDANFKEVELVDVRPGQSVTLTSDLYGEEVEFHGRVVGFSGGTGAAFALVPAQNATGNWIKVVQRLPVRIALDPRELGRHPLRVGLSMTATVHTAE